MLESILKPGNRIEMMPVSRVQRGNEKTQENKKKNTYFSKIYDIMEEDRLKIAIPTEGTKMIVLSLNQSFELHFVTERGLYRCKATVVDRYKENGLYVAIMELYTNLQRFQRRQHYRLSCNLKIKYWILTEEQTKQQREREKEEKESSTAYEKKDAKTGSALDISGGGMRFVSSFPVEKGDWLLVTFEVELMGELKQFQILSSVIMTREIPNRPKIYEHRVQFSKINELKREELIKYIFQEERRHRKIEKG